MISISMALNTTCNLMIHKYIFPTFPQALRSVLHQTEQLTCLPGLNLILSKPQTDSYFLSLSKLASRIVFLISMHEPPFTLMLLPNIHHPLFLSFFFSRSESKLKQILLAWPSKYVYNVSPYLLLLPQMCHAPWLPGYHSPGIQWKFCPRVYAMQWHWQFMPPSLLGW